MKRTNLLQTKIRKDYTLPNQIYLNLHFELEDNTKYYPSIPYTYILQKLKDVFHFSDMIVNDKRKDSCSTVIQNFIQLHYHEELLDI